MARTLPALLAVAGIALAMLAWLLWREHEQVDRLEAQLAATSARAARAPLPDTSKSRMPEAAKAVAPASAPAPASESTSPVTPRPPRQLTETQRKFQLQMTEYHRWNTLAKKANLLAALTLPPDKLGALKDLLAERDYVERDARDAAKAAGVEANTAAAVEASKIDARIRTLLGEEDYARYTELTAVEFFQQQLEGTPIPGSLIDAGVGLSPDQKTWLALQMHRAYGAELTDGASARSDPGDASREAFRTAALNPASSQLTPAQIDALREFFRKDDEIAALMKTMIRERAATTTPGK